MSTACTRAGNWRPGPPERSPNPPRLRGGEPREAWWRGLASERSAWAKPLRQPCGLPPPRKRGGFLGSFDFVPFAMSLSKRGIASGTKARYALQSSPETAVLHPSPSSIMALPSNALETGSLTMEKTSDRSHIRLIRLPSEGHTRRGPGGGGPQKICGFRARSRKSIRRRAVNYSPEPQAGKGEARRASPFPAPPLQQNPLLFLANPGICV